MLSPFRPLAAALAAAALLPAAALAAPAGVTEFSAGLSPGAAKAQESRRDADERGI